MLNVKIVLKARNFLLIMISLFLQACVHHEKSHEQTNLSKAASFNVQLGLGYLKQGDRPRAKKKLLMALEQDPKSTDANSAMAYYLEQTKEPEQAKKYYLKAMALAGNSGAQLNNYGAFLCRQGDFKKAEYYFLKAVRDLHYVNTAGAYENAGLCALSVFQTNKAKVYFTKALNQDPSRKVSFYELLKLEIETKHDDKARALIRQYPDLVLNDKMLMLITKKMAKKSK